MPKVDWLSLYWTAIIIISE